MTGQKQPQGPSRKSGAQDDNKKMQIPSTGEQQLLRLRCASLRISAAGSHAR